MKIAIIIGTRPEAIKIIPIIKQIETGYPQEIEYKLISTGQHDTMLKQVLDFFAIKPDYNLNLMRKNQSLTEISASVLFSISEILRKEQTDIVLVQGDTTTTFMSALSAFYHKIKIAHIEAGLRTYDKYQPFPEEINRHIVDMLADFCFAPTEDNKKNLLNEGISSDKIFVTGNTGIDTLFLIRNKYKNELNNLFSKLDLGNTKKIILITAHRRENFGEKIKNIYRALSRISEEFKDYKIVYPVHKNPNIENVAISMLQGKENVILLPPLNYFEFISILANSYIVLTDSGGVQEEAPVFGVPVFVMREKTERKEVINMGVAKLVGTQTESIFTNVKKLIENKDIYSKMSDAINPYGDGMAAERILNMLLKNING